MRKRPLFPLAPALLLLLPPALFPGGSFTYIDRYVTDMWDVGHGFVGWRVADKWWRRSRILSAEVAGGGVRDLLGPWWIWALG